MSSEELKGLKSSLNELGASLVEWLLAALNPVRKCQSLLSLGSGAERIRKSFRLWMASFVVSLVVFLPLYYYYGIGLSSLEFHLPVFLYLTLGMIGCGFSFWFSLRIYGIRATFSDLMAIYTAYVMCYQPVLNLFSYFVCFRFFGILASAKAQGLNLDQAAHYFFAQSKAYGRSPDFIYFGSRLSSWILLPLGCISSALMAAAVAERYSVPRQKSFSAVAFATVILVPIVAALQWMLIAFTEYVFVSSKSSAALPH